MNLKGIDRIKEACRMLEAFPVKRETEYIPLWEAYGRVLAEDAAAKYAVPSFTRSAFDGYALRSADICGASQHAPVTLRVTETIPAGSVPRYPVLEGMAARIMTGAMLPEGADAVVKHEDTRFTETQVTCFAPAQASNAVPPGEDIKEGERLAESGRILGTAQAAALAGQGRESVCVYKKPKAGIFSTGSELLAAGQELSKGKIYNTNPYLLGGYLKKYGMDAANCGIVEDDPQKLADRLAEAFAAYDMVITTGGVSAGDFDFIPKAAKMAGAKILFHKLPFKPGGSMLAAEKDGKILLGLSGNPAAAAVGLLRIGLPYMKKLCGWSDTGFLESTAFLEAAYKSRGRVVKYVRGRAEFRDGRLMFLQNANQRNGSVSSMLDCHLLAELLPENGELPAGTAVKVYHIESIT